MPPKAKYTRNEIVDAAYELVREQGAEALTAREVAKRLGTSPSPIFALFRDMEELKSAVKERAAVCFGSYMADAERYHPAYKRRGMQWVKFAQEEPMLFRLLFMQDMHGVDLDTALQKIPFDVDTDIAIIMQDYHATQAQAEHLFRQMWIYTYGMCTLCATKVCAFTEREIALRLGEIFQGMIFVLRADKEREASVRPVARDSVDGRELQRHAPDLSRDS